VGKKIRVRSILDGAFAEEDVHRDPASSARWWEDRSARCDGGEGIE
jgi:hypothetical protein